MWAFAIDFIRLQSVSMELLPRYMQWKFLQDNVLLP